MKRYARRLFSFFLGFGLLLGTAARAQRLLPRTLGTGTNHSALLTAQGTLYTLGQWGNSPDARFYTDTVHVFYSAVPAAMPGPAAWRQVAAGGGYTLAIRQDGTLWGWGDNTQGQLGDGTRTNRYQATQVGRASNWQRISATYNLSLGVRADGTLWAWGTNKDGQLGLDTLTRSYVPRQVGTATNWTDAVAGFWQCAGVRADGTLWAWGDNRLCWFATDSTTTYQRTPRQVGTDTTWLAVAVGWYHTAALRTDGTLWTWGRNHFGMLGQGTRRGSHIPRQVGTATDWRQVSAGDQHTMAVRANNTLWAWGMNSENHLGFDWDYLKQAGLVTSRFAGGSPALAADRGETFVVLPLPIDSTHTWREVECTAKHALAIRTDGSIWAWGYNNSSQVGPRTSSWGMGSQEDSGPGRLGGLRAPPPPPLPTRHRRRLRWVGH